jgi:hypothetical protein
MMILLFFVFIGVILWWVCSNLFIPLLLIPMGLLMSIAEKQENERLGRTALIVGTILGTFVGAFCYALIIAQMYHCFRPYITHVWLYIVLAVVILDAPSIKKGQMNHLWTLISVSTFAIVIYFGP